MSTDLPDIDLDDETPGDQTVDGDTQDPEATDAHQD